MDNLLYGIEFAVVWLVIVIMVSLAQEWYYNWQERKNKEEENNGERH